MIRSLGRLVAVPLLVAAAAAGCSKDPEVLKQQYLQSGNRYFEQKKYKEAIVEYRNAVQQDPRFAEARRKLATSYLQTGDPVNALREQVRAADLLPQDAGAQIEAGNLLLLVGRFEDAKARANKALAIEPANLAAQILLGNAHAGLKDFDAAIVEIEEALKLDPDRTTTYANLGTLQLARGDRKAAEATFRQAVARQPSSIPAQLALANFHWATGEVSEAETLIRGAVQAAPNDARTNRAMANIFLATRRSAEAEQYLVAASKADPSPSGRVALADYYIAAGRADEAATLLRALAEDPVWTATAKLRLASIEYRAGRPAEAERLADEVLSANKNDVRALLLKANVLVTRNQLDEAAKHVELAVAADPRSARAHYAMGKVNVMRRRTEDAKRAFAEALRVNPRAADAQIELARLHLAEGAVDKSLEYADQAAKNDPSNADARLTQVRALIARRQAGQADPIVSQLIAAFPRSAVVHTQLGLIRGLKKDLPGAAQSFEQALTLDPDHLEATAGLISLDLAARRPDAVRARIAERVARTPQDSAVLLLAGRTYAALGDTQPAEDALKKAIQVDALNLKAYEALGRLYMRAGRLPDAQREFEELAGRQSRPVPALTMVGIIQQSRNLPQDARTTYEKVLQLEPNAAVAANNLAWLYVESGVNLDLALQLAQTAKAGMPTQPEVSDTLGWIYCQKGLLSQAIRELEETIQRDPLNPLYQYHLGVAYAKNGNKDKAKRALETALRLRPDFDGAADATRLLANL